MKHALTLTKSKTISPPPSMEVEDELKEFLKAWATIIASLSYSYFISSNLPKGIPRFLSLLPVFSLFTLLPFSLSRPLFSGFLSGFISFLANFKLLHFSFNDQETPLSAHKSLFHFILFASLPIKIKQDYPQNQVPNRVLPLNLGLKSLLCALLLFAYLKINRNLLIFCGWMYLFNDVAVESCATLVGYILGVELEPPSDEPYAATSLRDFWGKRWNRMVSDALRRTIYKPTRSFWAKFLGRDWASGLALVATFVVSGLMHELVFYHVTRVRPTWEVTWFFVLHGVCVILEGVMKRVLVPRLSLHWAISGPLTVGFVILSGYWLFFPQVMSSNVDVGVMEDVVGLCKFLKDMVRDQCEKLFVP
uniref:Long-chain-alcohol O-fatty-acyltransferase n=2 Tax=Opuntia streptacantha TaxID=393608 RepID=A0A7C9A6R5_OPUST